MGQKKRGCRARLKASGRSQTAEFERSLAASVVRQQCSLLNVFLSAAPFRSQMSRREFNYLSRLERRCDSKCMLRLINRCGSRSQITIRACPLLDCVQVNRIWKSSFVIVFAQRRRLAALTATATRAQPPHT
jgi:hypothetical protein